MKTIKCMHCRQEFAVSRWDSWNGFLVNCPNCDNTHGKQRNIRQVMLASFIFNAISFLFTMRPLKAFMSLAVFTSLGILGYFELDRLPDLYQVAAVLLFILAPMVINGIILLNHHHMLDKSSAS